MKFKLKEVVNLFHELNGKVENGVVVFNGFLHQKMSGKTKLYVNRLNKIVKEEVDLYDKSRKEIFDKYAEGEGEKVFLSEEGVKSFNKENDELLKVEVEISVSTLWSSDLTPNDLVSVETEEYYPIFYSLVDNKE